MDELQNLLAGIAIDRLSREEISSAASIASRSSSSSGGEDRAGQFQGEPGCGDGISWMG